MIPFLFAYLLSVNLITNFLKKHAPNLLSLPFSFTYLLYVNLINNFLKYIPLFSLASESDGTAGLLTPRYSSMKQPPLIKQLKAILSEYPDGGQIIKVLITNNLH